MRAVDQARIDVAEGRLWRARDLLAERVAEHHDLTALDALGQVLHDMGDLPAAGAAWFATRRIGDDVDASVAAWRERYDDDFAAMWRSLPRSARIHPGPRRLEALRERARQVPPDLREELSRPGSAAPERGSGGRGAPVTSGRRAETLSRPPLDGSFQRADGTVGADDDPEGSGGSGGPDGATIIAWILAAIFVVCAVVGLVTILHWIVP